MKFKKPLLLIGLIFLMFVIPNETFAASKMPKGTKVADINVENKTEIEIRNLLTDEIIIWQAQDDIVLEGEFETYTVSRDAFQFDLDATMDQLKNKTKRSLANFFRRPKNVQVPFEVTIDESHIDIQAMNEKSYIDKAQLMDQLLDLAAYIEEYSLAIPYVDGEEIPLETIAEVKWDLPELSQATLSYLVDELDGQVIPANELFSLLQSVETPERLVNSRDETSFLGSALYTLFLQANIEIVERHPQLTVPSYGETGVNAEVNKREDKDLVVMNKSDVAYRLKMEMANNKLTARLEGIESLEYYEISIENKEEIKPRTLYRYSKKVNPGETSVVQAGTNGLKADVYRAIYENGVFVDEVLISKDLYLPEPRILLVSPDDVDEKDIEVEIGDDYDDESEYIYDEDGNIIGQVPSGSISDYLPDEIDDEVEYEAIKELEELQKQYEEFLDKMIEEYAKSLEGINDEHFTTIAELQQQVQQLDRILAGLVSNLLAKGVIDQEFIIDLIEQGLVNETFINVLIQNELLDEELVDEILQQRKDGVDNDS